MKTNLSTLHRYFQKAGGTKLLKQYFHNGVLGTAVSQFILLGKSRTALEILRRSVTLKTKEHFARKYQRTLKQFDEQWEDNLPHHTSKIIWIFWWQGEESMPFIVKKCFESVKEHLHDWDIILLTEQNYQKYASFPDFITEKIGKGITLTHFSDLLRLELLIKHGGLWLDATVLCTSGDIPQSMLKSDLFVYRPQKPGADGAATTMSSWMMWAKTNNHILMATQSMLYDYWKRNNTLCEYFLLHHFMSIVMDLYDDESKQIPPFCNSIPHILQLHIFETYDEQYWEDLKKMTCFHKLSYKFNKEDMEKKGTYYDIVIKGNLF